MSERSHDVVVTSVLLTGIELPDTPYALFVRGELDDALDRPDDGSRVEVIGGEIVVSPAPKNNHRGIVHHITKAFMRAEVERDDFPWSVDNGPNLDLVGIEDAIIPDLVVAETTLLMSEFQTANLCLVADEIEMVVEVTSRSTCHNDRVPRDARPTKWTDYARTEIPYYLLVDCDPKIRTVTLFSIPDGKAGVYLDRQDWGFGETVVLPEPFELEIPTSGWPDWS